MQPKLFLLLAVLVLVAALLGGNPFLSKAPGPPPAVPLRASPPASPAAEGVLPVGMRSTPEPRGLHWIEGRVPAANAINLGQVNLGPAGPVGLVVEPSPDVTGPPKGTGQAKAAALNLQCPDPLLRPLVIDVETHASGVPIWVLRDGRRLWRNPIADKEPLLVPVPKASRKLQGQ